MGGKENLIQELINEGHLKTPRIIDAFHAVDRADFVLPEYRGEAYGNYPLPIGEGQTISQPLTVAFMLELLEPKPGEKILDVGSGSGWTTALLTQIVGENGKVLGIERVGELCEFGQKNLAKYFDESRAKIICGDGTLGYPEGVPFDKILTGASASTEIPDAWKKQLKIGGKIVAPVGGSIWLFVKKSETEWEKKEFPGFVFVPLMRGVDGREEPQKKSSEVQPRKPLKPRKISTIGYCLLVIGFVAAVLANEFYLPHSSYRGSKSVEIQPGIGSRGIADVLKKEGAIRSKWIFVFYISMTGGVSSLKPGNYVFVKESIAQIVRDLIRGGTNEISITIPEGWSVKDIAEYLERKGIIPGGEFLKFNNGQHPVLTIDKFDFLADKPKRAGLEGYLFPDTYRIFKEASPEDIATKMLENFGKKLTPDLREEIARQKKTIFEIVVMASLIEKEAASDEDRAVISGILWKRLKIGMALQVDASVNYITGKKTPSISKEDAAIDSSYNTYKYPGFPVGPIANPGLSAIRSAIYPEESSYLYYLHTPDGRTIFSKTLEEHNEAKARYLR